MATKERRRKVGLNPKDADKVDPIKEAALHSQMDDRAFITAVARFVPYREFAERPDGVILGVDTFRLILSIALYDVFRERLTDAERATAIGIEVADLAALREHPVMAEVRAAILSKFRMLAGNKTFDQMAETVEDLMSREKLRIATVAWDASTRNSAVDSFISRRSAAKAREVNVTVMSVPPRLREELEAGFAYERTLPAVGQPEIDDGIDAGRLNVPAVKLIGSGSTKAATEE